MTFFLCPDAAHEPAFLGHKKVSAHDMKSYVRGGDQYCTDGGGRICI